MRQKAGPNPQDSSRPAAPPEEPPAAAEPKVSLPGLLRPAFERAAETAKRGLCAQGKILPMAVFAYRGGRGPERRPDEFKVVSLVWRTQLQKETVKRRIKEKALAERASAVVVLSKVDAEGTQGRSKDNGEQKGVLTFAGAMPDLRGSARATYVLVKQTKTITSWEMQLSADPGEHFFLEGLFPPSRSQGQK